MRMMKQVAALLLCLTFILPAFCVGQTYNTGASYSVSARVFGIYPDDGVDDGAGFKLAFASGVKCVELDPGTYNVAADDALELSANTTLRGAAMATTIIDTEDGTTGTVFRVNDGCTISDLTILGDGTTGNFGIIPASGGTVDGVLVQRVRFDSLGSCGLNDNGVLTNTTVLGCEFLDCDVAGLRTTSASKGINVLCCKFVNGPAGVSLTGAPHGVLIYGNTFTGCTTSISNTSGCDVTICGNAFISGTTSIVPGSGSRNSINDNYWAFDETVPGDVVNLQCRLRGVYYGSTSPASGTWLAGERVTNTAAGSGTVTPVEWYCTAAGTSGTWTEVYRGVSIVTGTATWNPGTINAGASETTSVTISGGVIGSVAVAGFSQALPDGWLLSAYVTSATTVKVVLFNATGSNADPAASGTITVRAFQ